MADVIWYDTAGCLTGSHYGKANAGLISPWGGSNFMNDWISGTYDDVDNSNGITTSKTYDPNTADPSDTINMTNDFATDLRVPKSMLTINDEDLYRDFLTEYLDMVDDCDIDCQKNGSQMTLLASLNATAFGFIAFNALLMFIGTWISKARFASVICTFFSALFQFCIIVVTGVILCSKYNMICARSMVNTFEGMQWTMRDDFMVVWSLWIASIILMIPFLCMGLCSTYRPMGGKVTVM